MYVQKFKKMADNSWNIDHPFTIDPRAYFHLIQLDDHTVDLFWRINMDLLLHHDDLPWSNEMLDELQHDITELNHEGPSGPSPSRSSPPISPRPVPLIDTHDYLLIAEILDQV